MIDKGPQGGLRGEWGRLIQAAPTIFFWYTRLSGILSLLAWSPMVSSLR